MPKNVGYEDWQLRGSAPGNPASGYLRKWADNAAGYFKCLTSAGAPAYFAADAATSVSGILPVANGGSGTSTPALVAGSNVTITGSWPNQTIAASGGGGGGGFSPYPSSLTIPLSSDFTWVNPNSYAVTNTDKSDRLLLTLPASAAGALWLANAALPSPPYTIDVGLIIGPVAFGFAQIALKNSSGNALRTYGLRANAVGLWLLNDESWTSTVAASSSISLNVMGSTRARWSSRALPTMEPIACNIIRPTARITSCGCLRHPTPG